jgi:hypothetical protein
VLGVGNGLDELLHRWIERIVVLVQDGGVGNESGRDSECTAGDSEVGVLTGISAVLLVEAAHAFERRAAHGHAQAPQQFVSSVEANSGDRRTLTRRMGPSHQRELAHVVLVDRDRWEVQDIAAHERIVGVEGAVDAGDEVRGGDRVGIAERNVLADSVPGTDVARSAVGDCLVVVEAQPMNGRRQFRELSDDVFRILLPRGLHDDQLEASVALALEPAEEAAQHVVPVAHERRDAQHRRRHGRAMTAAVRNVVICGAPRSGTSMLAEVFMRAGYHPGREFIPPSPANPHGFFEDVRVNRLNDDLLAALSTLHHGPRLPRHLWWMESLDGPVDAREVAQCRELVPPAPFVMKDPRFVYTGPAWMPAWTATARPPLVIVLVRPIDEVVRSLASMAARQPAHFAAVSQSSVDSAARVRSMWEAMYRSVLKWVDDDAIFVSEHDVRVGAALEGLGRLAGTRLDGSSIDRALHHHGDEFGSTTGTGALTGRVDDDPTGIHQGVIRRVQRDAPRLGV